MELCGFKKLYCWASRIGDRKTHFILPGCFFVEMTLMNEEVIGEDVVRDAGQIHLKKASSFVTTVANKPFVTPRT